MQDATSPFSLLFIPISPLSASIDSNFCSPVLFAFESIAPRKIQFFFVTSFSVFFLERECYFFLSSFVHSPEDTGNTRGRPSVSKDLTGILPAGKLYMQVLSRGTSQLQTPWPLQPILFGTARSLGVRIHSNSWGSIDSVAYYGGHNSDFDAYQWSNSDFLIVVAAGNEGSKGVVSPGSSKNVVTVGASAGQGILPQSSLGPLYDGRRKPDVVAPGYRVVSVKSDGDPTSFNCRTLTRSGTSMAVPFVSGAAAQIFQYLRDGFYPSGVANASAGINATGVLLKTLLIHSAVALPGLTINQQGYGRVDLATILGFASPTFHSPTAGPLYFWQNLALKEGDSLAFCGDLGPGNQTIRATLVWMDPPSAETYNPALINDLDLAVLLPTSFHLGNAPAPDVIEWDRLNNVALFLLPLLMLPPFSDFFVCFIIVLPPSTLR
eukprot:NODE_280_length_1544_cov_98.821405_g203_i0.p1 GENE.NODE_280_length_1544_cov_98.821405_g203_i0~~NODE_280_length_1544_cov_98.821405_g203_i0.p1  ORF type:complete len:436 (+),score=61.67 NODE_280_length_1544_cov_98.821405_g203_i0:235-1542(+)